MNVISELVAILGFDVRGEQDAERFSGKLDNIGSKAGAAAAKFATFAAGVGAAAAGATAALFAFVNPVAAEFDALIKQADQLSVSFEGLQALGFAAEQSGGSIEALSGSIRSMDQRLAEAARGTGRAKRVLDDYGLSAIDAEGNTKSAHDMMLELADVFDDMSTQERQDIARAFGIDQGTLNMLAQGRDAIEELTDEAERRGLVFDEEAARKAEEYNDQMNAIQRTWRAMRQRLALDLMPTMTRWMGRFDDWLMANRELITMRLDQGLQLVVRGIEGVGKMALAAGRSIRWLSEQIENLTGIGTSGQMAALGAGAGLWLASRHPVLAGLAAAFLMLDDLRAYMEGEDSAIGWALEWLDSKLEELGTSFEDLGERARDVLQPVIDVWNAITDAIEGAIAAAQRFLGGPEPAGPQVTMGQDQPRWTPKDFANSLIGQALGLADPDEGRIAGGKQGRIPATPSPDGGLPGRQPRLAPDAPEPSRFAPDVDASVVIPSPLDVARRLTEAATDFLEGAVRSISPDINPARFGPVETPTIEGMDDLRSRLEAIQGGLSQVMDLSIRPHDVAIDRSVDFQQTVSTTITQHVTGATAAAAAGSAVEGAADRAGRRAADLAAQEPSLN